MFKTKIFLKIFLITALTLALTACTQFTSASEVLDVISNVATVRPVPTATPGPIAEVVKEISKSTGANRVSFLFLTGEDWVNLLVSLLLVLLTYIIAGPVLKFVFGLLTPNFEEKYKRAAAKAIVPPIKWMLTLFVLQYVTTQLAFLSPVIKILLGNIYFSAGVFFVVYMFWKLIDIVELWYLEHVVELDPAASPDPVIVLLRRVAQIFIILIGFSTILSRLGFNTNALTLTLGIMGLALTLAGRDTLSDVISGFTILADRPFRVGDAIEIEKFNDWGIVNKIGLRTTHIRTFDNRVLILPNSIIGSNLIVNYSYPDPRIRLETMVQLVYGTNIEEARELIIGTISKVDGVLDNEPINVLCHEMGESGTILRVWWWIADPVETAFVRDRVIEALNQTFQEKRFTSAYPIRELQLQLKQDTLDKLSWMLKEDNE